MDVKGISFKTKNNNRQLTVIMEPLLIESAINAKTLNQIVQKSQYCDFFILDNEIFTACDQLAERLSNNAMEPIETLIGEAKDAEVEVTITADKMFASLTITAPYHGDTPNLSAIISILAQHQVKRGVGKKRINELLRITAESKPGMLNTKVVARGLAPREGKNSFLMPLVPNVLERVLAPTKMSNDKVDMRDFGELICVTENQAVAQRMPPTLGRSGFTVTGELIASTPGQWKRIKLGDNVYIQDKKEDTVFAKVAGLPKFAHQKISISDVLVSKGCNVATGNIKYVGAVIINGDVTEKMRIECDGDVTINGFVESAYIESGGDIVITQGASGKKNETDCQLIAKGSIFLEHGQGLDIDTGNNLIVAKQLAYSNIKCRGKLTVGRLANPMGKLFACNINCYKSISAGYIGAVSGSIINIDFSDGYTELTNKLDAMVKLFKDLSTKNADHEIKISGIKNSSCAEQNQTKLDALNKELELERVFLNWLRINVDELKVLASDYQQSLYVLANRTIYSGVNIKFLKSNWKANKEHIGGRILREDGKWTYQMRK